MSVETSEQLLRHIRDGNRAINDDRRGKGFIEKRVIIDIGEVQGIQRSCRGKLYDRLSLQHDRRPTPLVGTHINGDELLSFYIQNGLKPDEIESSDSLHQEFSSAGMRKMYELPYSRCETVRRWGNIVSSVHATHDPKADSAYLKFQVTTPDERGTGISQRLLASVLHALHDSRRIDRLALEGVGPAEGYWNALALTPDGIGTRRPYGLVDSHTLVQMKYKLPDLKPDPETGDDTSGGPIEEHFHSLYRDHSDADNPQVPRAMLEDLVIAMQKAWQYERETEGYDDDELHALYPDLAPKAVRRRNDIVRQVREEVFASVPSEVQSYFLLSRELRGYLRDRGYEIQEHGIQR